MAAVTEYKVHTGHTIALTIEGTTVGRAQGIDGDRSFGTEGVYEIGSIMPQEHVQNRYEGSVNLERFFMRKADLVKLGFTDVGEGILKKGVITIQVTDKYTGEKVRTYHGCTIVTYRETFRVNAIAGENATFAYLYAD